MSYTISEASLKTREENTRWGALFSLALVGLSVAGHMRYPETYNDVLLWSVAAMVLLGNLINYYRYRRYLRRAKQHRVDVDGDMVTFTTEGEESVLDVKDIAALTFYRKKGAVEHIQVKLRNNRGIRLEGYGELEQLGGEIADRIPKAQVNRREP